MLARNLLALALPVALGLSGCITAHSVPFADRDFAYFAGYGPATLTGSALGRTRGGEAKTCAGYPVYLAPGTAYDDEAIGKLSLLSVANVAAGPAFRYWRRTACDAQGRFMFQSVPPGEWYVLTSIQYDVAGESQGGMLVQKVALRPGPNDVMLTTEDSHIGLPF